MSPLVELLKEVPAQELARSLDEVLFDYAILSARAQQSSPVEESVVHLSNIKRLRDAFTQLSSS